jgi:hypothetical protein
VAKDKAKGHKGLKQEKAMKQAITTNQSIALQCKPITIFRTPYYPRFMVVLGTGGHMWNHLQLMVGLDHKKIFFFTREREKKIEVKEVEESKERWIWF